ncbi:hypothetical protein [Streptomyces sp. NPDC002573]|uniref:hypothetical protein n=1 Tax=Streptomyces sp. NPDC002573 TaxID=3364651 RepID=UPI003676FF1E
MYTSSPTGCSRDVLAHASSAAANAPMWWTSSWTKISSTNTGSATSKPATSQDLQP